MASPQHAVERSRKPAVQRQPAQKPAAQQRALGPQDLVEGSQVEYNSDTFRTWIPCVVTFVDAETGNVKLDVKPDRVLDLVEQHRRLRPRTRPQRPQLEWVRRTLREGRLEEEAQAVFRRHAKAGRRGVPAVLDSEGLGAAGAELDALLGVSGCICALRKAAPKSSEGLGADGFGEACWELLWRVQRDYGQALLHEDASQRCRMNIQEVYSFERALGAGTFGVVKLARSRATGAERAVKMISKQEHAHGTPDQVQVEIEHLCLLDHPHIVKLYEHYQDASHIHLVMDFCSGGELREVVVEHELTGRSIPEAFVVQVMRQVMMAIAHVHSRGIVHLDLKSTNIMLMPSKSTIPPGRQSQGCTLADVNEKPHVMIIDLGVAQIFRPGNFKFNRPMGTPATMAPEVWRGEIHPKADVFSCGVVLFELLSLAFPFRCGVEHAEAVRYWASKPPVPWHLLRTTSKFATELCRRMLALERHARPTASTCLRMPYLREPGQPGWRAGATAPQRLVRQLSLAPKRSVLHRSVALSLAREWPANQLPSIKRLFHEIDVARSGRLTYEQLEAALKWLGMEDACAREVAQAMDLSRDGTVCWTEFVAACVDLGSSACEGALRRAFDEADADGDGLLSQQDLRQLFAAEHLRDDQAARDVFAELAGRTDHGARLDWPTFRQHFCTEVAAAESQDGSWEQLEAEPLSSSGPQSGVCGTQSGTVDLLGQARGFMERAYEALWPEARSEPSTPDEDDLRQLAEMGFTDREKCIAVLRKYQNRLNVLVVNELVNGNAERPAHGVTEAMSI